MQNFDKNNETTHADLTLSTASLTSIVNVERAIELADRASSIIGKLKVLYKTGILHRTVVDYTLKNLALHNWIIDRIREIESSLNVLSKDCNAYSMIREYANIANKSCKIHGKELAVSKDFFDKLDLSQFHKKDEKHINQEIETLFILSPEQQEIKRKVEYAASIWPTNVASSLSREGIVSEVTDKVNHRRENYIKGGNYTDAAIETWLLSGVSLFECYENLIQIHKLTPDNSIVVKLLEDLIKNLVSRISKNSYGVEAIIKILNDIQDLPLFTKIKASPKDYERLGLIPGDFYFAYMAKDKHAALTAVRNTLFASEIRPEFITSNQVLSQQLAIDEGDLELAWKIHLATGSCVDAMYFSILNNQSLVEWTAKAPIFSEYTYMFGLKKITLPIIYWAINAAILQDKSTAHNCLSALEHFPLTRIEKNALRRLKSALNNEPVDVQIRKDDVYPGIVALLDDEIPSSIVWLGEDNTSNDGRCERRFSDIYSAYALNVKKNKIELYYKLATQEKMIVASFLASIGLRSDAFAYLEVVLHYDLQPHLQLAFAEVLADQEKIDQLRDLQQYGRDRDLADASKKNYHRDRG